jgi:hypothetical protein
LGQGQVRDTKESRAAGNTPTATAASGIVPAQLWPANRQRISLVLGKPSFLNKPAHGLDFGAAAFSTQHFKFKLKTLQ